MKFNKKKFLNFTIEADYQTLRVPSKNHHMYLEGNRNPTYRVFCIAYAIVNDCLIVHNYNDIHYVYKIIKRSKNKEHLFLGKMFIDTTNGFSFTSETLSKRMPEPFRYNLLFALKFLKKYSAYQEPYCVPGMTSEPDFDPLNRESRYKRYYSDFFFFCHQSNSFKTIKYLIQEIS